MFTRHQQAFCSMGLTSARFCQQMCEIPSPCFKAVFTGLLLGHSSLPPDCAREFAQSRAPALTRYVQFFCSVTASRLPPPDFASRCVKSLALVLMRYLQAFSSITAHFRQIVPVNVRNPEPCIHAARAFLLLGDVFTVPSARFCQQRAEIPSPCFNAVFTGFLLDHSSLPPDFARGFVQSRALAFTRHVHFFCSVTASRFPPPDFASRELKSLALVLMRYLQALLDHSSLPPDFARGFVQSRALAFTRYVQFFCSV